MPLTRNSRRLAVSVVALVALAVPLLPTPAGAGGVTTCDPISGEGDARLRKLGKPYSGNNVYDVGDQTVTKRLDVDETARFDVKIRNDSGAARNLVIEGGGSSASFRLRYFRGPRNITDKVTGDGKQFTGINPDASTPPVRVKIKLLVEDPLGLATIFPVTGRFSTAPTEDEDECTGDTVLPRIPDPIL